MRSFNHSGKKLNRRDLLKAGLGVAVAGGVSTLYGCGGGGGNSNLTPVASQSTTAVSASPSPTAATSPSPTPAPSPSPTPSPVPAFVQPQVRTSSFGVLDTSLNCKIAFNTVGGTNITARSYEGVIGGPTLRVKPGDTLRINLINSFPPNTDPTPPNMNTPHNFNSTNLHTHGLHVSPSGNSDNIFVTVSPSTSFQYEYKIPLDHPQGTFWYHPHLHGAVSTQMFSGMGGALIVQGGLDDVPEVAAARDIVYLINELSINPQNGTVPLYTAPGVFNFAPNLPGPGTPITNRVFTINGQVTPTLYAQPGEVIRLRVINAGPRTLIPFSIDGHTLNIAAYDGITLHALRTAASTTLAPANRVDILLKCGAPGTYAINKGVGTDGANPDPALILGYLTVQGTAVNMGLPTTLPAPASLPDITAAEITGKRTFVFDVTNAGGPPGFSRFSINGLLFDPNVINTTINLGAVEEWTLTNKSPVAHPFHIHINPFQVVAVNGVPLPQPEWHDTYDIPKNNGNITIRSRFENFTGLFVFHCHILPHEDIGMMQTVNVV